MYINEIFICFAEQVRGMEICPQLILIQKIKDVKFANNRLMHGTHLSWSFGRCFGIKFVI